MPLVTITADTKKLIAELQDFRRDQFPFAMKTALNTVALGFQQAERAHITTAFTIRRPWMLQGVKIPPGGFATKTNLAATVQIDPTRDEFTKFEQGTPKTPIEGGAHIAIPIDARRTKKDIVKASDRPKALHLRPIATKNGKVRYAGDRNTFLLNSKKRPGVQVIVQRMAQGKRAGTRVLWLLVPKVPTPNALKFVQTAQATFQARMDTAFSEAYAKALASARPQ